MKRPSFVTIFLIPAIIGIISLFFVTSVSAQTEAHPWDVNGDGVVDINDVMFVGSHFGDSSVTSADANGDGLVDIVDLVLVSIHFGEEYEPTEIIGNDGAPMVLIPAGEFMMGDHHGDGWDDERPVHPVYLDAFYMDKYEVTNAQFKEFVEANPEWSKDRIDPRYHNGDYLRDWIGNDYPEGKGDHPVIWVSWYAAAAYAQFYGKRLPTEAEREMAARGAYVGEGKYKKYVWGDGWPPPKGAGNFRDESTKKKYPDHPFIQGYDDGYAETAPVGSFDPNGYGLHDMAGNVWEWCQDWYDRGYYFTWPRDNPTGPTSGTYRISRGGGWFNDYWYFLRVAFRFPRPPAYTSSKLGFRCGASRGD